MLKRLFLTLLIACLAIPAAATAVAAPQSVQHHASAPCHGAPDDAQDEAPISAPAKHQCIGCVPLVAEVAPVGQAAPLVGIAALGAEPSDLFGSSIPPATPPPRA